MAIRRFNFLTALIVVALAAPGPALADGSSDKQIVHVLNRIAFGPTPADAAHVKQIGIDRYIDEQLHPDRIPEPPELTERLAVLDTLKLDPAQLFAQYGPILPALNGGVKPTPEEAKARRRRAQIIVRQAQAARIWRALYSRRQLQEVMVGFWYDHFNVFAGKGLDHLWAGNFEATAIRPYALGHFRDLLLATAHHPAMLFYLDNQLNTAPGSPGARGNLTGLNENYAREIMELHTLGVDGGYTQADVESLARILTGWGLERRNLRGGAGAAAGFDASRHDFTEKTFLGRTIAPTGEGEGTEAIGMLASSPATAHHIAFELAQYFVADKPPPGLVDRLAQRFRETDGDIAAVMKTLLASREFRASAGQKYKTPYQYVLSAARAAGVEIVNPRPLLGTMARLGEPLFYCQTPDGYKNTEDAWLSPDATTLRIGFATGLGRGVLPLNNPPPEEQIAANPPPAQPQLVTDPPRAQAAKPVPLDPAQLEQLLAPVLSDNTRAIGAEARPDLKAALILGSPDFMRR
ncbi:MAG TPA: DUF1800 domain-containing protein [Stellaceae bacterium]|nr:DUF1800 domain-containing protein [Stellaceae bacterium]